MSGSTYDTPAKVLKRAQEAIGKKIKEIDTTGRLQTGNGGYRDHHRRELDFGYSPNSTAALTSLMLAWS